MLAGLLLNKGDGDQDLEDVVVVVEAFGVSRLREPWKKCLLRPQVLIESSQHKGRQWAGCGRDRGVDQPSQPIATRLPVG